MNSIRRYMLLSVLGLLLMAPRQVLAQGKHQFFEGKSRWTIIGVAAASVAGFSLYAVENQTPRGSGVPPRPLKRTPSLTIRIRFPKTR